MNKNKSALFLLLVLALTLSACGSDNVVLDNPGSQKVTFVIDGESHDVGAGGSQGISLDPGTHTMDVGEHKGVKFEVKKGGLLHTGETTYLTWKILYGLDQYRKTELKEDTLLLDKSTYFGDFVVHPDSVLFIEGEWDYAVNEPLPKSKDLVASQDFTIKSKIFRKADFLKTYEELSAE